MFREITATISEEMYISVTGSRAVMGSHTSVGEESFSRVIVPTNKERRDF